MKVEDRGFVTAVIQVRDGKGLSRDGRGGPGKMASDSGYILKVQPVGFVKGSQMWGVRERGESIGFLKHFSFGN